MTTEKEATTMERQAILPVDNDDEPLRNEMASSSATTVVATLQRMTRPLVGEEDQQEEQGSQGMKQPSLLLFSYLNYDNDVAVSNKKAKVCHNNDYSTSFSASSLGGSSSSSMISSKRRRRQNHHELLFDKRWQQSDLSSMLTLKREYGVAMYDWYQPPTYQCPRMEFDRNPTLEKLRILSNNHHNNNNNNNHHHHQIYDILYCHGEPNGTDQDFTDDFSLSRSVPTGGTLTFEYRTIPEDDYFYSHGEEILYARLHNIPKTIVSSRGRNTNTNTTTNNNIHCNDGGWENVLQIESGEFREFPPHYFGITYETIFEDDPNNLSLLTFCVTSCQGIEADDEYPVFIRILSNEGTFDWIPNELAASSAAYHFSFSSNNVQQNDDNRAYIQYIQQQAKKRLDTSSFWKEEHSWLCRYMGLPAHVAWNIHSYYVHTPPSNLTFSWKPNDLLLEWHTTEYATSWTTYYIARPRPIHNHTTNK